VTGAVHPLQNRADPFGLLHATPVRGAMMGNRGGRIHTAQQMLGPRSFASRRWICCELRFRERRRRVWGQSYTEMFFLDEVTALAGGHRPCFECRREEAAAFAACFPCAFPFAPGARPRADDMDRRLHEERLAIRRGERARTAADSLPDGAMLAIDGAAFAVRAGRLLAWSFSGYRDAGPVADETGARSGGLLTPPSIVAVLRNGYRPRWDASAASGASGASGASAP